MVAEVKSFIGTKDGDENPFMALVDAATSILDKHQVPAEKPVLSLYSAATVTKDLSKDDSVSGKSKTIVSFDPSKKSSFAEILMSVLDDESYADILAWMPDGKAFTIVNPKKFSMDAMPKLFNIRNMSSFVRKLGRWGFQRVHERETKNSDIFKHPSFQKNRSDLCAKIKCVGRLTRSPAQSAASSAVAEDAPKVETLRLQQQMKTASVPSSLHNSSVSVRSAQAVMFLEEARRLSELSTGLCYKPNARQSQQQPHPPPPSFPSRPSQPQHALHSLTSQVVSAALETLRRDDNKSLLRLPMSVVAAAPPLTTKANESAMLKSLAAKYHVARATGAPVVSSYGAGSRRPTLAMAGGPASLQLSYGNRFGGPAPSFAFLR